MVRPKSDPKILMRNTLTDGALTAKVLLLSAGPDGGAGAEGGDSALPLITIIHLSRVGVRRVERFHIRHA